MRKNDDMATVPMSIAQHCKVVTECLDLRVVFATCVETMRRSAMTYTERNTSYYANSRDFEDTKQKIMFCLLPKSYRCKMESIFITV